MRANCILVRYGEIALKGKVTRRSFERTLVHNIKKALDTTKITYEIISMQGRVFVKTDEIDEVVQVISHIFGVTSCSPVKEIDLELDALAQQAFAIVDASIDEKQSFALRVNRSGTHDFTSQDIAVNIGAYIQKKKQVEVDLTNPDLELFIEVRNDKAYLFIQKIKGPGGMPLGTQGNILSVIESQQDILASWYLMKRGCKIVFLIDTEALMKQTKKFLLKWHAFLPLFIHDKTQFLNDESKHLCMKYHCGAICMGSSLDYQPEKTMQKIHDIKKYHQIPILTPLISFNTTEIEKEYMKKGIAV